MKIGQLVKERYEILEILGEGGMAFVYKARDMQLERFVAIKTLKPNYVNQETFVDRFKREAKTAANLNHPNIVQIFDWGIEDEPYFVMEYIEGNTLTSIIAKNRTISLSDILFIGAQVSSGLHAAHQKGLVHRDIKPGNIMITPDGKVKVTDFGIVSLQNEESDITKTGSILGTASYISPEQAQGKPVSIESDLYSLGTVLYELITGKAPFSGDSPISTATKHLTEKPEKPFCYAPPAAGAGLLVLILGQVYGPKPPTHAATTEVLGSHRAASEMGKGTREQGAVRFFSGRKEYNTITMPHLGPSDASHVLVKYFDYTCRSCRDVHADLQFVAEKHPGSFCVILLPVPLHRDCNPFYPADLTNHDHACELARLSLAAWRAKPALWPEVHEQLFSQPVLPPEVAEAAVGQIVGHDELTKALEDPWINEHLESNVNDFKQMILTTRAMPKMVIGDDQVLHGVPRSKEVLLQTLGQHYKLN